MRNATPVDPKPLTMTGMSMMRQVFYAKDEDGKEYDIPYAEVERVYLLWQGTAAKLQ